MNIIKFRIRNENNDIVGYEYIKDGQWWYVWYVATRFDRFDRFEYEPRMGTVPLTGEREQLALTYNSQEFYENDLVDIQLKGCMIEEKRQKITYSKNLSQFRFGTFGINDLREIKLSEE